MPSRRLLPALCVFLFALLHLHAQWWLSEPSAGSDADKLRFANFDGRSTIVLPRDSRLALGPKGTIEFWVVWRAPSGAVDHTTVVSRLDGSNSKSLFAIAIAGDGNSIGILDANGKLTSPVKFRFDDGEMHHVAVVTNGANSLFFIDGKAAAAGSQPRGYGEAADGALVIGATTRRQGFFSGSIGDLRVWNDTLDSKVLKRYAVIGADRTRMLRVLTFHPEYHHLVVYSDFADQLAESTVQFANPLLGLWMERSTIKVPDLLQLKKPAGNDKMGQFEAQNHGNFVRPPVYTAVSTADPNKVLLYQDSTYYGLLVGTGANRYRCETLFGDFEFTMQADGSLHCPRSNNGAFGVQLANVPIVLKRPDIKDEPFRNEVRVKADTAVFSGWTQQFGNNFRGWNVTTVNPFMPAMSAKRMADIFQKPDDSMKPTESGKYIPTCLIYVDRSLGGGGKESHVCTSGSEIGRSQSIRLGVAGEFEVMGSGAGLEFNSEIKQESNSMRSTSTTKVTASMYVLKHALVADMAQMELSDEFREMVMELNSPQSYDAFFNRFGTHFAYAVTYGAMIFLESNISSKSFNDSNKSSFDISGSVSAKLSYKGLASGSLKLSGGYGQGQSRSVSGMFENDSTKIWYCGGDGMLAADPTQAQIPVGDNVTVVHLDLRPIYQLLSPEFFSDPHVYQDVQQMMKQRLNDYLNRAVDQSVARPAVVPDRFATINVDGLRHNWVDDMDISAQVLVSSRYGVGSFDGQPFIAGYLDLGQIGGTLKGGKGGYHRNPGKTLRFRVPGAVVKNNGGTFPDANIMIQPRLANKDNSGSNALPTPGVLQNVTFTERHQFRTASMAGTYKYNVKTKVKEDNAKQFFNDIGITNNKYKNVVHTGGTTFQVDVTWWLEGSYADLYSAEVESKLALMRLNKPAPTMVRTPPMAPQIPAGTRVEVPNVRITERPLPFPEAVGAYFPLDKDLLDYSGLEGFALAAQKPAFDGDALALSGRADTRTYVKGADGRTFTVHLDFYPTSEADYQLLSVVSDDVLRVAVKGGLLQADVAKKPVQLLDKPLALGRWHKLVLSWDLDSHVARFYVDSLKLPEHKIPVGFQLDGREQAQLTSRGAMLQLGSPYVPFDGKVDEVIFYNRALNDDQVTELASRPREAGGEAPSDKNMYDDSLPEFGGSWLVGSLEPLSDQLRGIAMPSLLFEQTGGILKAPLIDATGKTVAHLKMITNRTRQVRLEMERVGSKGEATPMLGWVGTLNDEMNEIRWTYTPLKAVAPVVQKADVKTMGKRERVEHDARQMFRMVGQSPDKIVLNQLPKSMAQMAGTFKLYDTNNDGVVTLVEAERAMLKAAGLDPDAKEAPVAVAAAHGPAEKLPELRPWRRFDLNGKWRQDNQDGQTSIIYTVVQEGMQITASANGYVQYEGNYLGRWGLELRRNNEVTGALLSPDTQFITLDDGNIWQRLDETGNPPRIAPPPFSSRSGYYDRGREDLLCVRQYGSSRLTFFLIRENDPTGGQVLETHLVGDTYFFTEGQTTYQATWDNGGKLAITRGKGVESSGAGALYGDWQRIDMSGDWNNPLTGNEYHVVSKNSALYVYRKGFLDYMGIIMPKGLQFSAVSSPDAFFRARLQPPGNYLVIQFTDVLTWKRGKFRQQLSQAQLDAEMTTDLAAVKLGSTARVKQVEKQIVDLRAKILSPMTAPTEVPALKAQLAQLEAQQAEQKAKELPQGPSGDGFLTGKWRDRATGLVYGLSHSGTSVKIDMVTEAAKPYWPETTGSLDGTALSYTMMNQVQQGAISQDRKTITWKVGGVWERLPDEPVKPVLTGVWIDASDQSVFTISQDYAQLDITPVGGPKQQTWPSFGATHKGSRLSFQSDAGPVDVPIGEDGARLTFSPEMVWNRLPSLSDTWVDSDTGQRLALTQDGLAVTGTADGDAAARRYGQSFQAELKGLLLNLQLPAGAVPALISPDGNTISFDATHRWTRVPKLGGSWKEDGSGLVFSLKLEAAGVVSATPAKAPFPGFRFVGTLSGDTLSMTFGQQNTAGTLSADRQSITWTNGRTWRRQP